MAIRVKIRDKNLALPVKIIKPSKLKFFPFLHDNLLVFKLDPERAGKI